jgi:hypothetical protein
MAGADEGGGAVWTGEVDQPQLELGLIGALIVSMWMFG